MTAPFDEGNKLRADSRVWISPTRISMEPPAENNFVAVVHGAEDGERLGDNSSARSLCSSLLIDQVLLAIDGRDASHRSVLCRERQSVSVAAKRPEDFCDAYQGPFKEVLVVREELEVISHGLSTTLTSILMAIEVQRDMISAV
jgi:hypothetical protein